MSSALSNRMLKIATSELVSACASQVEAARHCGKSDTQLQRYRDLNGDNARLFMPVDVVRCLEQVSGNPAVTRALAREAGFELVPVSCGHVPAAHWPTKLAAIARESSELTTAICDSLSDDDRVCARDVRRHDLIRKAQDLAELGVRLADLCRRILEDEE